MRIEMIAYTDQGHELGRRLAAALREGGDEVGLVRSSRDQNSCSSWTERHFETADALVYIGATGIAVRNIAPLLKNKLTDPAVIVVDAVGQFVVSLLSGHAGGANRLARRCAAITGGTPVITTGTDSLGLFSIDDWAARQGLVIANPGRIVEVSGGILRGETRHIHSDFPIAGTCPDRFVLGGERCDVAISCRSAAPQGALHLVPPALTLGIGCRRGTTEQQIIRAFVSFMGEAGYHPRAVARVASIDLKADEVGLRAFCENRGLPFITYRPEALAALPGDFTPSTFVRDTTGVDNVCERSAAAGGGQVLVKKTVVEGIALALAGSDYPLTFEEAER